MALRLVCHGSVIYSARMSDNRDLRHSPAAERNRAPILEVLKRVLPPRGLVLEVASGTGQHVAWFARHLPALEWQPSDGDPGMLPSIAAWIAEAGLGNVRAPIVLDASAPTWPLAAADAIYCANMVHIAPWPAALGLFAGAGRLLPAGGVLCTYGPYRFDGSFTAPSNSEFDVSLRTRDPGWGVREVRDLEGAARAHGLALEETVPLPANNHVLVFRKIQPPAS
jgi:SAM-dependent methyltransferase